MKYLIIRDGAVVGSTVSDHADVQVSQGSDIVVPVVENHPADVGWLYGEDSVFTAPLAPPLRKKLTPPEFKMQFLPQERLAIRAARAYVADANSPANAQLLQLKAFLDDFYDIVDDPRLTIVDLNLQQTQQGIAMLAAAGLIDTDRVPIILAGIAA